jgi:hypothetical protein
MTRMQGEETRIVARLPHVDLAVVHRRANCGAEEMLVALRLAPPGQAIMNPLLPWMLLSQALWSSWLGGLVSLMAAARSFETSE